MREIPVPKILFIFGTRPEAIKLCPVLLRLKQQPAFDVQVCVTAQHRSMLDQVLQVFDVVPDCDLDLMQAEQSLSALTSRITAALETVMLTARPDLVIVQGDTTTTFAGALAGFYQHVPVAHVEAGLRTGDMTQPFPEEMNRVLTSRLSTLHFAPTERAARNLMVEGVKRSQIYVTGNPGIDAVLYVRDRLECGRLESRGLPKLDAAKKLIVVTAHRRESFGAGMERICEALVRLAGRPDVEIVYPVHCNPNVTRPVYAALGRRSNIFLIEPLEYVPFVDLMRRAHILVTDSGGIQEEGPSLGKPVLVMRDKTERPEAVEAGTVKLVGTNPERIAGEAGKLLDDAGEYRRMARIHNPYGDGRASHHIAAAVSSFFAMPDEARMAAQAAGR